MATKENESYCEEIVNVVCEMRYLYLNDKCAVFYKALKTDGFLEDCPHVAACTHNISLHCSVLDGHPGENQLYNRR